MSREKKLKEIFYIEKVPGDVFQGLGWIKVDLEQAKQLNIPHYYTETIFIPNSEPYTCPIQPHDKTQYFQLDYQEYYQIYLPRVKGKSKNFSLHTNGEKVKFSVQQSLTMKAVFEWAKTWADAEAKLVTPGNKVISFNQDSGSEIAFVYFILNKDSSSIKIGMAKDVEKRLKSLQTSSPVTLNVLKVIQLNSMEEAKNLESQLHQRFESLRMSGEWFRATQELFRYIHTCKISRVSEPKPYRSIPISEL